MDSWMYAPSNAPGGAGNGYPGANTCSDELQQDDANNNPAARTANYSAIQAYADSTSPSSSHDGVTSKSASHGIPRVRRRNRQITSCLECRRRKLKCDKQAPCTNCTRFRRDCLYLAPALDASSQQKLADLKEKMGALEKGLEREVTSKKAHLGGGNVTKLTAEEIQTQLEAADDEQAGDADEDALEPTPLAALDQVYEDNADDELMDLGVQMVSFMECVRLHRMVG